MAIVAGIDEAGLGPVLGPLVVSATAFELPEEMLDVSLWRLLQGAICRKPSRKSSRVAIDDSKKLYSRQKPNALLHLERGVLGMLATQSAAATSLGELLERMAPEAPDRMKPYPWYGQDDLPLPRSISPEGLALICHSLRLCMARAQVRLIAMRSEPVFVGDFNRHVAATRNKSAVLFDVTSRLLSWLWRRSPAGRLRIFVDRHGGRQRYLPSLQRVFAGCEFKIVEENEKLSAYRITGRQRQADICFCTDGESRQLPVALASMTSKYLRELFMEQLNCFWVNQVPGLSATAGYYTDGRRFYREISPAVARLGLDEKLLYRCR